MGDTSPVRGPGEDVERAYRLETQIKRAIDTIRSQWVPLAQGLYEFNRTQAWQALGYETFEQWLASPEIELGRRTVFGLIDAYRTLVVDRHVPPAALVDMEITKVRDVLPAIRRGHVDVEAALEDVRTLARSDLRRRYERPQEDRLDAGREPEWAMCDSCGSRYLVRVRDT